MKKLTWLHRQDRATLERIKEGPDGQTEAWETQTRHPCPSLDSWQSSDQDPSRVENILDIAVLNKLYHLRYLMMIGQNNTISFL